MMATMTYQRDGQRITLTFVRPRDLQRVLPHPPGVKLSDWPEELAEFRKLFAEGAQRNDFQAILGYLQANCVNAVPEDTLGIPLRERFPAWLAENCGVDLPPGLGARAQWLG